MMEIIDEDDLNKYYPLTEKVTKAKAYYMYFYTQSGYQA